MTARLLLLLALLPLSGCLANLPCGSICGPKGSAEYAGTLAQCRTDPQCARRAQRWIDNNQEGIDARERRMAEQSAEEDQHRADFNAYMEDRHAASDAIVANAAARNARDTAAVTAATPSPAQVPQQPTRQPDPLAFNSAIQAEAAQARKGAGTDLCPNAISDIECANRVNALQEQARGQH